MSEQASRFVDSIPGYYERFLGPHLFRGFADDIASRAARAQPESVLELAAGTGIVSRCLRDVMPPACNVTATDLNSPMLELARTKFDSHENIQFRTADACDLPFDDDSFDAVVCQFGVMFFPDKLRSYEEVLRVLTPGGRYLLNVWCSWEANPFARIAHEAVARFFPADPPGFYKVPFGYNDESEIEHSLLSAGFGRVDISSVKHSADIISAADFAAGLVFGNPLYEEVTTRGGDPDDIRSAVAASIERELGDSMPLEALVIEAEKA